MLTRADFERFVSGDISPEDVRRRSLEARVDSFNALLGEDDGTGIHCGECLDKGEVAFIHPDSGNFTIRPCHCYGPRLTVRRLQRCGIWERAKSCRMDDFRVDTPTRATLKETVQNFIENPGDHWLLLCGQSGVGKTHLCTAAFVELSRKLGVAGQYLVWNADSRKLKAAALDDEAGIWERYKTAGLLYVDDLFKARQDVSPSDADIRLAFELLDFRDNNRLPTIISCELPFNALLQLDQAIAGRIKERCGQFLVSVAPDASKNYRLFA